MVRERSKSFKGEDRKAEGETEWVGMKQFRLGKDSKGRVKNAKQQRVHVAAGGCAQVLLQGSEALNEGNLQTKRGIE